MVHGPHFFPINSRKLRNDAKRLHHPNFNFLFFGIIWQPQIAYGGTPKITSITGYSDARGVVNGRWTGQPSHAPSSASNRYKSFLVSDTYNYTPTNSNPYYWDINGNNFGSKSGRIFISWRDGRPVPIKQITIIDWKTNGKKIRIKVVADDSFYLAGPIIVYVQASTGEWSAPFYDNYTTLIKSRGLGQCTYWVASVRRSKKQTIPEMAYPNGRKLITYQYEPKQYDVLFWGTGHTAIIYSVPTLESKPDGTRTWNFTVSEMNAKWDENVSYRKSTFSVNNRSILKGILSNGYSYGATHYWR